MKIYIEYEFTNSPHGGGNQFLLALKKKFEEMDLYTKNPEDSDIILFNGHHCFEKVMAMREKYKEKIFVHRLDGLQKLYNNFYDPRQGLAFHMHDNFADATIFQSEWAKNNHIKFGLVPKNNSTIIMNAVDDQVFNTNYEKKKNKKIQLIAVSWSANINKGFDVYSYLDKHLDFEKYSFLFVGNKPELINFENIEMCGQKTKEEVAALLKKSDIYITASRHDCCSNSLIEALSCGLPAVALNSGGNFEIVKDAGALFNGSHSVSAAIEAVTEDISKFSKNIKIENMDKISKRYVEFFEQCIK